MVLLIAFCTPFLIGGFFVWPFELWLALLTAKIFSDFVCTLLSSLALGRPRLTLYLPLYEIYFTLLVLTLPLYFLTGRKVVWKGKTE
jgi:hypothetical protein